MQKRFLFKKKKNWKKKEASKKEAGGDTKPVLFIYLALRVTIIAYICMANYAYSSDIGL